MSVREVSTTRASGVASGEVLAALRASLDGLFALDAHLWADGASLVELVGLLSRVEALVARQAAAFARGDAWSAVGAKTPAAWLTVEARCDAPRARAWVGRGRKVARFELVDAAFAAGAIGIDHVDRLTRAALRSRYTAAVFERDEAMLVEWASTMAFGVFVEALELWLQRADADRAERLAQRQHRRRRLHVSKSFEDTWYLNGVLDPISGHIVNEVLAGIERELFEADWAEARAKLGWEPSVGDLARTAGQRRADALVEMAARAATVPKDGRRPRPLFTVVVDVDTFRRIAALSSGVVVTPGEAARWVDAALIERVVFDGPDRVLAVGYQRTFTGALRRAIEVRDRSCQHPYCDVPADLCQVDHVVPWARGGPTTQHNGELRCGFHNRGREPDHIRTRRPPRRNGDRGSGTQRDDADADG